MNRITLPFAATLDGNLKDVKSVFLEGVEQSGRGIIAVMPPAYDDGAILIGPVPNRIRSTPVPWVSTSQSTVPLLIPV